VDIVAGRPQHDATTHLGGHHTMTTVRRARRGLHRLLLPGAAVLPVVPLTLVPLALVPGAVVPASAQEEDPVVLTVGLLQDVDSLNPFAGITLEAFEVWGLTYDSLTGSAQSDLAPVPALAESWEESADGRTWTYQIREGVTWSDGTPLTARDAAYTFTRIIEGASEQTNYGGYVASITKAEAPDDTTLVLSVDAPSPIMTRLAVPILPEHVWSDVGPDETATFPNEPLVGSGPFTLVEYRPGQFLRFAANEDYWAGPPVIDELVLRVFGAEDAMVQALRKGEVDLVSDLSANTFASLQGVEGVTTVAAASTGFDQVGFNVGAATVDGTPIGDGHPAFEDVAFRQALAHAIDRDVVNERLYGGLSTPATTVIPPIYPQYHLDLGDDVRPFDLDLANQLLDEAGYARGPDGVRRMPDGSDPLTGIRYYARAESPTSQKLAPFVQEWFGELGIELEVEVVEENRLIQIQGDGEYDVFDWGWGVEPDPDFQLSVFLCDQRSTERANGSFVAGLSDTHYCNPEYDALYRQQQRTTDLEERAAIVREMQAILYEDAPYVLTVYNAALQAYRSDRWEDVRPQPDPGGPIIFQFGTYTYRSISPVTAAPSPSASPGASPSPSAPPAAAPEGGLSTGAVVALGLLAAAAVAGTALVLRRRRTVDERE
jgi:peptide/nickel transport system substrate-binding protein